MSFGLMSDEGTNAPVTAAVSTTGRWFLLRTKPRQETLAVQNLERQKFRVFLPFYRRNRRRKGSWLESREPLFPGYLFVFLDFARQNTASIRSTRGVADFVRFGIEPRPVPDAVVNALLSTEATVCHKSAPLFKPGDQVAVVAGGFSGLQAIFQAEKGSDRVILLFELLGRAVQVALHRDDVVPVT
jgi:transcriptional antiterminator RfaH